MDSCGSSKVLFNAANLQTGTNNDYSGDNIKSSFNNSSKDYKQQKTNSNNKEDNMKKSYSEKKPYLK